MEAMRSSVLLEEVEARRRPVTLPAGDVAALACEDAEDFRRFDPIGAVVIGLNSDFSVTMVSKH